MGRRLCTFDECESSVFRCSVCGLSVTLTGGGEVAAVCGRPETVRVFHGSSAPCGPGTHLRRLLSYIGITAGPGCKCGERARLMDEKGPDWCEKNINTIVGWLEEEAKGLKGLLFSRLAARMLVRKAIRLSRRDLNG